MMSKPRSPSCNMEGTSMPLGYSVSQSVGHPPHLQQNNGGNWLKNFCLWKGNNETNAPLVSSPQGEVKGYKTVLWKNS